MPALLLFLACFAFSVWFVVKYDESKFDFFPAAFATLLLSIVVFSIVGGILSIIYLIFYSVNSIFAWMYLN